MGSVIDMKASTYTSIKRQTYKVSISTHVVLLTIFQNSSINSDSFDRVEINALLRHRIPQIKDRQLVNQIKYCYKVPLLLVQNEVKHK